MCLRAPKRRISLVRENSPFNYARFLKTPKGIERNLSVRIPKRTVTPTQNLARVVRPPIRQTLPATSPVNVAPAIARANATLARGYRQLQAAAPITEVNTARGTKTHILTPEVYNSLGKTRRRRFERKMRAAYELLGEIRIRKMNILAKTITSSAQARQQQINTMREEAAAIRRRIVSPPETPATYATFLPPQRIEPESEYDPVEQSLELVTREEFNLVEQIQQLRLQAGMPEDDTISLHPSETFE